MDESRDEDWANWGPDEWLEAIDELRDEGDTTWGPDEWLRYAEASLRKRQLTRKTETDGALIRLWKQKKFYFNVSLAVLVVFSVLFSFWGRSTDVRLGLVLVIVSLCLFFIVDAQFALGAGQEGVATLLDSQRRQLDEIEASVLRLSHRVRPFEGPAE